MKEQKKDIIEFVRKRKLERHTVTATLKELGVSRSTYYSWLRVKEEKRALRITLTPYEKEAIQKAKEECPHLRHRQIQGMLQKNGLYISYSSVYHHLKSMNLVEPYERRPSPLKEPRYNVWGRNLMWGFDWSRLRINHTRWYLLILIDFFSRYVIAYDICPSVNSSHITHIYKAGLKSQGIHKEHVMPKLRVDRGSPNTSLITQEFFTLMGTNLSFARVRRPTDNALTERFFGTAKQEEIYLVGNYPDERSAHEEIGRYIHTYNYDRPHQSLWNFTPAFVHEINNNTVLLERLAALKYEAKMNRALYRTGKSI